MLWLAVLDGVADPATIWPVVRLPLAFAPIADLELIRAEYEPELPGRVSVSLDN